MPSLNIVTTSMSLAPVLSTLELAGNFTATEPSVPNVAVLDPVPSCVMIRVTVPPVGNDAMLNCVLVPRVTVCTLAVAQSTVIVLEDVSALIDSLYPTPKVGATENVLTADMVCVVFVVTVLAADLCRCTLYAFTVVDPPDVDAQFSVAVPPLKVPVKDSCVVPLELT